MYDKDYGYSTYYDDCSTSMVAIMKNTSLAAPGALAHRLQSRTIFQIQNGHQGAPKWQTGSGRKRCNPRLLGALINFC